MRRYRIPLFAALILSILACSAILAGQALLRDDSSEPPAAVELPSACENFVEASKLLARDGSAAAVSMTGGDVLAPGRDDRRYDALRSLLDACDAELAARSGLSSRMMR